jgi:hypothetical protein
MPIAPRHPSIAELLEREMRQARLEAIALRKGAASTARLHNQVRRRILDKVAEIRARQHGTMHTTRRAN